MSAALADALALLAVAWPFLGAVSLVLSIVIVSESHPPRRRVRESVAPLVPTEVEWDWRDDRDCLVRALDEAILRELDIADRGGAS